MVMARKKPPKEKDIIDQMLDNIDFKGLTQDEVAGQDGLIKQLTGRILRRALEAEMTEHPGYEKNSSAGEYRDFQGTDSGTETAPERRLDGNPNPGDNGGTRARR